MSKKGRVINLNKPEPLTIEKLRKYKGLENLTDEQAEKILQDVKILVSILLEIIRKEQKEGINTENKKAA